MPTANIETVKEKAAALGAFSEKPKKQTYYGRARVSSDQIKIDKALFIC
jgi:hypothetical protein